MFANDKRMKKYQVDFFMYSDSTDEELDFVETYAQTICDKLVDGRCDRDMPFLISVTLSNDPDKNRRKPCKHGWWFTYHFKNNINTMEFAKGMSNLDKYVCSVSYQLGRFKVCSQNPNMECN